MSRASNFSKARSHIIFLVALLAAAAYILWVEKSRGVVAEAAVGARTWSAQLGRFDTAEAAGRAWDIVKRQEQLARFKRVAVVEGAEGVMLNIREFADQPSAERVCASAAIAGIRCVVSPPAP